MEEKRRGIRPARYVEFQGKQRKLKDLCAEYKIAYRTAARRIDKDGMTVLEALTRPHANVVVSNKKKGIDERQHGVRTKILNRLLETFYKDPGQFEKWIEEEMAKDYGAFFRKHVQPFLPTKENSLLDKGSEKAVINIQFNAGESQPKIEGAS